MKTIGIEGATRDHAVSKLLVYMGATRDHVVSKLFVKLSNDVILFSVNPPDCV